MDSNSNLGLGEVILRLPPNGNGGSSTDSGTSSQTRTTTDAPPLDARVKAAFYTELVDKLCGAVWHKPLAPWESGMLSQSLVPVIEKYRDAADLPCEIMLGAVAAIIVVPRVFAPAPVESVDDRDSAGGEGVGEKPPAPDARERAAQEVASILGGGA